MRLLGAILAGGQSRRFGSDKAVALVDGLPLMEHAVRALAPQVELVVSCGRAWPGLTMLEDRPEPHLGPLGGLNAALHFAAGNGFDAVLAVPVDTYPLPPDLAVRLMGGGSRHLARHHAIGLWQASLAELLDRHLASGQRSVKSWIEVCGAMPVADDDLALVNMNTPDVLIPRLPD